MHDSRSAPIDDVRTSSLIKNILVGLIADPQLPSAALDLAFDLARRCDAHVTVQVDTMDDMPVGAMNYEAAFMVGAINDRFTLDAKDVVERVRAMAKRQSVSCRVLSWTATHLALKRNFAAIGRTHDLTMLDAGRDPGMMISDYIETALFETGRPLMVVPKGFTSSALKRGLIAWDGSAEAARAVNDALPMLRGMESVEIVSFQSDDDDRLRGIGLHLQRHGIDAAVHTRPILEGDVGHSIIARVDETQADLVVMGGYSHSRVLEWILGGTTRALLKACPTALFMSH